MYFLYLVTSELLYSPETGNYRSFAIQCYQRDPFSKKLIASIPDVSTNEVFVQNLADLCTSSQLHSIHLMDVILDAL